MSDVIDEDLLKELGLNEDDLKAIENKKKSPPQQAAAPSAAPKKAGGSEAAKNSLVLDESLRPAPAKAQSVKTPDAARPDSAPKMAERPVSLDDEFTQDVPVQLAAVLAKKTLTLGEILQLRVGEIVELSRKPTDAIDLVANGKLVAKAELVMIDGQIGVRILKLVR